MGKYKALLVDFDNTLIGPPDRIVRPALKKEIMRIIDEGVLFTIATGRPYFGKVKETVQEVGSKAPQIVMGGAEIVDPITDTVLWGEYIPEQEAQEIKEILQSRNLNFSMEKGNLVYCPEGKGIGNYGNGMEFIPLEDCKDFKNFPKIEVTPLLPQLTKEQADQLKRELEAKYHNLNIIMVHSEGKYGFNITSEKASKHIGVLEYLKLMHLDSEQVIGAGDGYNDYPLLTACGFKVAMGDAPPELKEIADLVVPTQKEDGLLTLFETCFNE